MHVTQVHSNCTSWRNVKAKLLVMLLISLVIMCTMSKQPGTRCTMSKQCINISVHFSGWLFWLVDVCALPTN